jgi:hypothetical protein
MTDYALCAQGQPHLALALALLVPNDKNATVAKISLRAKKFLAPIL